VINLANKEVISVLNPVTDVVYITSLDLRDLSTYTGELGSLADKLARERNGGTDSNGPHSTDKAKRNLASTKDPKAFLNASKRDYNIVGPGVSDKFFQMAIKPLEIVKIYFNFTDFPDKLVFNDHIEIKITNQNDEEYRLPYYLNVDNNRITNKKELLVIRIFNWTPADQTFKVGLNLFHGLFVPVLEDLSDKVWIEVYHSER
jgi:hypothetical protein